MLEISKPTIYSCIVHIMNKYQKSIILKPKHVDT